MRLFSWCLDVDGCGVSFDTLTVSDCFKVHYEVGVDVGYKRGKE